MTTPTPKLVEAPNKFLQVLAVSQAARGLKKDFDGRSLSEAFERRALTAVPLRTRERLQTPTMGIAESIHQVVGDIGAAG